MPTFIAVALVQAGVGAGIAAAANLAFSFWAAFATATILGGVSKTPRRPPA